MKPSIVNTLKRAALILTMAAAGLSVGALGVPAAHASILFPPPSIATTVYGVNNNIEVLLVTGAHFTPNGPVRVLVYDSHYRAVSSRTVTASPVTCGPIGCLLGTGGRMTAGFEYIYTLPHPHGTVHIIADDITTFHWSNWSNATFPAGW